jgi:hypothetical protein
MSARPTSDDIPAQPAPGDVTLSPTFPGFIIGQVSRDTGQWVALDSDATWPAALWKAHYYARVRGVRALVSRDGEAFHVADPDRLWLGGDLAWHPHDTASVAAHAPAAPGVYVLRSLTPVFVGHTENLRERLLYHLREPWSCPEAAAPLQFCVRPLDVAESRSDVTADLIAWWTPPCNEQA